MPEFIINLLQDAGTIELIAGAVLAFLGVQNRDKIMALIKSLLNGGKTKPDDGTTPVTPDDNNKDTDRLTDEIALLRAKATITTFGDKYQHQKCAADVREAIAHMLTDTVDANDTEPAHA